MWFNNCNNCNYLKHKHTHARARIHVGGVLSFMVIVVGNVFVLVGQLL